MNSLTINSLKNFPGFKKLGKNNQGYQTYRHVGIKGKYVGTGQTFVLVPGGNFQMGGNAHDDEKPIHKVNLKEFLMCEHVVTQRVWKKVMKTEPWKGHYYVKQGGNYPAVCITWNKAKEFSEKTGLELPSESRWEYACRAGSTTEYYWGNEVNGDYLWYDANAWDIGEEYAHEVGKKKPNEYGLYDMSGNVWEWCADEWHRNYDGAPGDGSVWGDIKAGASARVNRGGSFGPSAPDCRSAFRVWSAPGNSGLHLGFRLCFEGTG